MRQYRWVAALLAAAVCGALIQPPHRAPTAHHTTVSSASTLPPLQVVGLGDSVMAGTACGCPGVVADYVDRLSAAIRQPVTGENLGVPGDTAADLLHRLRSDRQFSAAVAAADVVIVTVGANDLQPQQQQQETGRCPAQCFTPATQTMGSRVAAALAQIRAVRPGPPATLLVTTYWNVFADGAVARAAGGQPQLEWSEDVTEAANRAICAAASKHAAYCVDLNRWFDDEAPDPTTLLAADGDHPNAAGVEAITTALLAATARPPAQPARDPHKR